MGFLRLYEITHNQRPLVCSFDVLDYITSTVIGTDCGTPALLDDIDQTDNFSTAIATRDAWVTSIKNFFSATFTRYINNDDDTLMSLCISQENFDTLIEMAYGTTGFFSKYKEWHQKSLLIWNTIIPEIDKQTGEVTDTYILPDNHNTTEVWEYTIDYTDYQTLTRSIYQDYRTSMGEMMQSLKQFLIAINGDSFENYRPVS
jgi:hypothetical protein